MGWPKGMLIEGILKTANHIANRQIELDHGKGIYDEYDRPLYAWKANKGLNAQ
jgi:hypothetical protein